MSGCRFHFNQTGYEGGEPQGELLVELGGTYWGSGLLSESAALELVWEIAEVFQDEGDVAAIAFVRSKVIHGGFGHG